MSSTLNTWVEIPKQTDFTIYNLPFGIFSATDKSKRIGVAIGDQILDLVEASSLGIFDGLGISTSTLENDYLNDFIALGKKTTSAAREKIQSHLCDENSPLKSASGIFIKQEEAQMHLPVKVGDYTDFYSSIEHATNVGKMFRDPENALLPNWKHLPVGYHGRASSIIVSGEDIHRPKGQTKPDDGPPVFGPCKLMDFELEMAFIVGKETELGDSVSTDKAEDHIFGMVLFNDWSARDIQKWEYVPLGPFLGKSFASSISPWVVTMEALDPFRVTGPEQEPEVLPYLQYQGSRNYDIDLEVLIQPESHDEPSSITKSNFKYMYWNMAQQLAHHTVNGCNVKVGDMMASGTISGKDEQSFGSMLELSWAGSNTVPLKNGEVRKFLQDGDTVIMRGHAEKNGIRIGFGEVRSKLLPAK
ncbi:MAG: fumarylacetoacetase [Balneolaceae bacterium]|nr:fumarylacetoacetase [Balneolaceae bacterium]MBO6545636.1 fumarylacetoacetase [Balneolaceae bacterium]MBO6647032.1 fumarylacetoacetase [Balneolaceae bacterium]